MKRTPIRRISKQKAKADRELKAARARVLARDDQSCQFLERVRSRLPLPPVVIVPVVECRSGLHVHHVVPRSRGGGHDDSNLVTLCGWHHEWVHGHPIQSRDLGLLGNETGGDS